MVPYGWHGFQPRPMWLCTDPALILLFVSSLAPGVSSLFVTTAVAQETAIDSRGNELQSQLSGLEGAARIPVLILWVQHRLDQPSKPDAEEFNRIAAEILHLNQKENRSDYEGEARILESRALLAEGKYSEAYDKAQKAITLLQHKNQRLSLAQAHYLAAVAEFRQSNHKSAKQSAELAYELQEKEIAFADLATTLTLLGVIDRSQGQLDTAIEHHLAALRISQSLGRESGMARSQNNLGLIYWQLRRLDEAKENFILALDVYREMKSEKNVTTCLSNLGLILIENDQAEEALPILEEALSNPAAEKSPLTKAEILSNLAFAHEKLDRDEEAMDYNNKALALREKINDKKGIVRTQGSIAVLLQKQKRHQEAVDLLQTTLLLAREISARSEEAAILESLADSYDQLGDPEKALFFFKESFELSNEIQGPEVKARIAEATRLHEKERALIESRIAKNRAELNEKVIRFQRKEKRNLILAGVVLLVFLILVSGLYFSRARALRLTRLSNENLQKTAMNLKESEARYRMLFESADVPKILVDSQSNEILDMNLTAQNWCGIGPGQESVSLESAPEWLEQALSSYFRSEPADEVILDDCWTDQNGDLRWTEIRGASVTVDGKPAKLLNVRDTTEKRTLEREQMRSEKLESLGILAGGLAHDFNNALMAILGYAAIVRKKMGSPSRELDLVEEVALKSSELTGQLLAFAKGNQPKRQLQPVAPLLRKSVELSGKGSKLKIEMEIDENLWQANLASGQFQQVVSNLVINANEAMPSGGMLAVRATNLDELPQGIECEPNQKFVCIEFVDNGVGIPKQFREKIFDPYWTSKKKGSGLGLATSFSIMKRHDGAITCKSREGIGTNFSLFFPACDTPIVANEFVENEAWQTPDSSVLSLRVLVLDDEPLLTKMYKSLLELEGHQVVTVSDGESAVATYLSAKSSQNAFDLLIMDLTIPGGIGGREAIKRIHSEDPSALAIVASGYSNDPTMANFKEAGFVAAISKPFTEETLKSAIRHAVVGRSVAGDAESKD